MYSIRDKGESRVILLPERWSCPQLRWKRLCEEQDYLKPLSLIGGSSFLSFFFLIAPSILFYKFRFWLSIIYFV